MQMEHTKEDQEPSYDNIMTTIGKTKKPTKTYGLRQTVTRPVFKWTALATAMSLLIIIVVVPTVLEITKQESIQGSWGNWTSFSDCSHSCHGGSQYRTRSCNNPSSAIGGMWCPGNDTDEQPCNNQPCPVHGVWGNWSSFSECSQTCGGGMQTRKRNCDNPSPEHGGQPCPGNASDAQQCNQGVCPVHGNWGSWTIVSGCTHSCVGGARYRIRECNNPYPVHGGDWCSGNATELQPCNTHVCPEYRSAFTVRSPTSGPTSGTITFTTTITNFGGHYDTTTGQFKCQNPGYYVFSLHLYKYPSISYNTAHCYVRKNEVSRIRVYSNPYHDNGHYETSNSVILHLSKDDKVDLGDCSSASSMWEWTSFTGYLIKPD